MSRLSSDTVLPKACLICLGSNSNPETNILKAIDCLTSTFPGIRWGKTVITHAEGQFSDTSVPDYHNIAATFSTSMDADGLKTLFRKIEKACGRTPLSKSSGIVPLDIDLLEYDGMILKPSDMKAAYVRRALASLKI